MPGKPLFETCDFCAGKRTLRADSIWAKNTPQPLRDAPGENKVFCPACGGAGFVPIRLTVEYVAALVRERDELRARVAELERMT